MAVNSIKGDLKVVIVTRNLGHAGSYGFAYTDVPLTPAPDPKQPGGFSIDLPGEFGWAIPPVKIDDHWWKVGENLD
jgi:hypothetical protein